MHAGTTLHATTAGEGYMVFLLRLVSAGDQAAHNTEWKAERAVASYDRCMQVTRLSCNNGFKGSGKNHDTSNIP